MKSKRLLPVAVCGAAALLALGVSRAMMSPPPEGDAPASAPAGASTSPTNATSALPPADIDLTQMRGPMVYSQVFEMLSNPPLYRGKTVRMRGTYGMYSDEETGKRYHACLISDAMACCQQGIEFAPTNAVVWPQDFPAPGSPIAVQGVFDTYEEKGQRFVYLRNAVLAFKR
jgi:hypothetical protein